MAVSKAQQKAVNKYVAANYDRVNVTMPKGKKDVIKAHAEARGESVNAFIGRAIDETMERDNGLVSGSTAPAGGDTISASAGGFWTNWGRCCGKSGAGAGWRSSPTQTSPPFTRSGRKPPSGRPAL